MKGKIVILGTSSAIPTKKRNNSGIYFKYLDKGILFDCGEGILRQLVFANIGISKIDYMFITHKHPDHILGIPGILQALDMEGKDKVEIFSPKGLEKDLKCFLDNVLYIEDLKIKLNEFSYTTEVINILETDKFLIKAAGMNHGVPCFGYSFEEKPVRKLIKEKIKDFNKQEIKQLLEKGKIEKNGKLINIDDVSKIEKGFKFTYITDTYKTDNIIKLSKGSDILIIESTYLDEEEKAEKYKHLTLNYILEIYPLLNCKKMVLTHFSRRYKNLDKFKEKIKKYKNIILGEDFMTFEF